MSKTKTPKDLNREEIECIVRAMLFGNTNNMWCTIQPKYGGYIIILLTRGFDLSVKDRRYAFPQIIDALKRAGFQECGNKYQTSKNWEPATPCGQNPPVHATWQALF